MEDFKPKVFISYTWSNNDYIAKVTQFVNRLVGDGVDVLFDQYEMKPGKSLNNYMEKSVHDPSVTNVLLLLNPDYKIKADSRKGGTGIETQIISAEVYQDLDNDKFIPILFDKMGKDASACVPIYLKDRYRLDLSDESNYEDMYMAVLRAIYKKPTNIKPVLGTRPSWLDDENQEVDSDAGEISKIKQMVFNNNRAAKRQSLEILNDDIKNVPFSELRFSTEEFEKSYNLFSKLRKHYLSILTIVIEEQFLEKFIFEFFENLNSNIGHDTSELICKNDYIRILKHELIIETVALLFKNQKYNVIGSLITRTYLDEKNSECLDFDSFFYSHSNSNIYWLDHQLGLKYGDGNRYKLTGIGDYWIKHVPEPFINRDEFAFSDVLISNLSIANENKKYAWFAITYVYVLNNCNSWIRKIALSLKSKKLAEEICPLFNVSTTEALKMKIANIQDFDEHKNYRFGYNESFETIDLISKHLEQKEVCSLG